MSIGNDCGFDDGLWLFAILALLGFGNNGSFGFGNNGSRIGEAYATQADIQRAVNLNSLQEGQAEIESVIRATAADTIGSIKDGNYNILGELRDVQMATASGFSSMKDCCCEIRSMIMENRYLTERQANSIISAIRAEGDATRALINSNEMNRLRDELSVARSENADYRQSQFMLGQIGKWYSNPPCYGPCGNQGCNN